MFKDLLLEAFLERNRIDDKTWKKANIDWPTLQAIAADHEAESANLEKAAELFAKVIQKFNGVHSVRWRVKDSEHLVEKIVRKRYEGNPKYADITQENYFERVTDLVGVRALHLFKENCFEIDAAIKAIWDPIENTVAYIREGDSEGLTRRFEEEGFEVKNHPAGYRSIHYVIESAPLKRKIIAEIQVRTIFEEGWSEIDHKIRYPNFSDNELVRYFLEIFNRMAGSADDMGGFVLGLVATISHLEKEIIVTKKEKTDIFQEMEQALSQLESVREQGKESRESVAKLKMEIAKLKEVNQTNRSLGLLESTAAEQASRGLINSSLSDILKSSAAVQDNYGIASSRLSDLLKPSAAEQASRGLINSSLSDILKSSAAVQDNYGIASSRLSDLLKPSAVEQARRGLINTSLSDILKSSAAVQINPKHLKKED